MVLPCSISVEHAKRQRGQSSPSLCRTRELVRARQYNNISDATSSGHRQSLPEFVDEDPLILRVVDRHNDEMHAFVGKGLLRADCSSPIAPTLVALAPY